MGNSITCECFLSYLIIENRQQDIALMNGLEKKLRLVEKFFSTPDSAPRGGSRRSSRQACGRIDTLPGHESAIQLIKEKKSIKISYAYNSGFLVNFFILSKITPFQGSFCIVKCKLSNKLPWHHGSLVFSS